MQFRLVIALSLSILLIGGASFLRFFNTEKTGPDLIAVENAEDLWSDEELLKDFLTPKTSSTTPLTTPTTNSDLIGRQLIMDYITLSASGNVNDADLSDLANKYIESLPTLNQSAVLSYDDLKTVSNSKANFQSYATEMSRIYSQYAAKFKAISSTNTQNSGANPALYSFFDSLSAVYTDAAVKFKAVNTPTALLSAHLRLTNSFYSSAAALQALSQAEKDSASAFSGLVLINDNVEKEETILAEITQILTSNGI